MSDAYVFSADYFGADDSFKPAITPGTYRVKVNGYEHVQNAKKNAPGFSSVGFNWLFTVIEKLSDLDGIELPDVAPEGEETRTSLAGKDFKKYTYIGKLEDATGKMYDTQYGRTTRDVIRKLGIVPDGPDFRLTQEMVQNRQLILTVYWKVEDGNTNLEISRITSMENPGELFTGTLPSQEKQYDIPF